MEADQHAHCPHEDLDLVVIIIKLGKWSCMMEFGTLVKCSLPVFLLFKDQTERVPSFSCGARSLCCTGYCQPTRVTFSNSLLVCENLVAAFTSNVTATCNKTAQRVDEKMRLDALSSNIAASRLGAEQF